MTTESYSVFYPVNLSFSFIRQISFHNPDGFDGEQDLSGLNDIMFTAYENMTVSADAVPTSSANLSLAIHRFFRPLNTFRSLMSLRVMVRVPATRIRPTTGSGTCV